MKFFLFYQAENQFFYHPLIIINFLFNSICYIVPFDNIRFYGKIRVYIRRIINDRV